MSGTTLTAFTPGDLVISISGNGDNSGAYTDNQASPLTLEELTPDGAVVGILVLPQAATTNAQGTTEYAFSVEYGSSSEGTLELSADGHFLVIAGYAVNAAAYNTAEATGNPYGNAALAQTTSIPGGPYTAVARVVALIGADAGVDSSTALYNIDNTNNPRSVATVDGSSFYISGQGVKGDTTQGLFLAQKGASAATAIDTSTDTRTVEIVNGQLYVSRNTGTNNQATISSYGSTLPAAATAPTALPGFGPTVTLTAAQANGVDNSRVGKTVYLAPENFFFANATTLYVADDGKPKNGSAGAAGLGDGGLQKWSLVNGQWMLDYVVTAGLALVANTAAAGTTGLIGLIGRVSGSTVQLYATNATVGDTDPTALYAITDSLAATTLPATESFTTLLAAAPDTNIRGVAFAPTPACYCHGTLIRTDRGDVAVELLAIGDRVLTLDGRAEPVRWIGRRSYAGRALAGRSHLLPVVFRAGSLGDSRPTRDLRVSPMHAMFLDGVLVPAWLLVNDRTIVRDTGCPAVDYVHVELASHEVIWAEGAPAESFLDDDSRFIFQNAREYRALYPAEPNRDRLFCAPRAEDGPELEAIRRQLEVRAANIESVMAP